MDEPRLFARFRDTAVAKGPGLSPVPDKGLCLSAFLLVREKGAPYRVLLGRMNPDAPWDRLGGVDTARLASLQGKWLLPACQLLYYESPAEAAQRIAHEMLNLPDLTLAGPRVESEAYPRPDTPGNGLHWDLQFLFDTEVAPESVGPVPAWTELRFVDPTKIVRSSIGRGHADILEFFGFRWK